MSATGNIERLLAHIEPETLAAELVRAYADSDPTERAAALKEIANLRLETLKDELGNAAD